jgi:hypothetical protein
MSAYRFRLTVLEALAAIAMAAAVPPAQAEIMAAGSAELRQTAVALQAPLDLPDSALMKPPVPDGAVQLAGAAGGDEPASFGLLQVLALVGAGLVAAYLREHR